MGQRHRPCVHRDCTLTLLPHSTPRDGAEWWPREWILLSPARLLPSAARPYYILSLHRQGALYRSVYVMRTTTHARYVGVCGTCPGVCGNVYWNVRSTSRVRVCETRGPTAWTAWTCDALVRPWVIVISMRMCVRTNCVGRLRSTQATCGSMIGHDTRCMMILHRPMSTTQDVGAAAVIAWCGRRGFYIRGIHHPP
jgi:hypothetical protein